MVRRWVVCAWLGWCLGCASSGGSSSSSSGGGSSSSSSSSSGSSAEAASSHGASSSGAAASSSATGASASSQGGSGPGDGTAVLTGTAAFLVTTALATTAGNTRNVYLEETAAAFCGNPLPPSAIHTLVLSMQADGGPLLPTGNHAFSAAGPWTLSLSSLQADGGMETTHAVAGTLALTENSGVRCKGYITAVHLVAQDLTDAGTLTGVFNATACP